MSRAILRSLAVAALVCAGALVDRSLALLVCPRNERHPPPATLLVRYGVLRPGEQLFSCRRMHREPEVLPLFSHMDHFCLCGPGDLAARMKTSGSDCRLADGDCPQARCDGRLDE